jgi:GTP-binding protein EngB required for normal cell division
LGTILIGKIIFYWVVELAERGYRYFNGGKDSTEAVKNILDTLSDDKKFINDVSNMIDAKKGIDDTTAKKMVKLPIVQTQIKKVVNSYDGKVSDTEIEKGLKDIFLKAWSDNSITNKAIEKVKNDIK